MACATICALEKLLRQSPAALAVIALDRSVLLNIAESIYRPGPDAVGDVTNALKLIEVRKAARSPAAEALLISGSTTAAFRR